MMKRHISITVDERVYEAARRRAAQEQRSVSMVFERAVALSSGYADDSADTDVLPVSNGAVAGTISRADSYGDRV